MGEFLDILKRQPDFKVKRSSVPNLRGPESIEPARDTGEMLDLDRFITKYHPRTRITRVEIEYNLDGLDVARITFVDPEYEVFSLLNWEYIWEVAIGYNSDPDTDWATFVGVPQIELPHFPKEGEPIITIVLLGVVVRMTKHHTFNPVIHSDQVQACIPADIAEVRNKPNPIMNAVRRIARSHGLLAYYGSLQPGDALLEVDTTKQPDEVLDRVFPLMETLNDAQYLDRIVDFLNAWEADRLKQQPQLKQGNTTMTESEEKDRTVQILEPDEYRWGQLGNLLILAKWKRDIWDSTFGMGGRKIPVFQYRYGNMALLEFFPRISKVQKENGFQIWTINKQTGDAEYVGISNKGKVIEDVVPLNLQDPRRIQERDNLRQNEAKKDFVTLLSVGPDRREALLDLSSLWESSGINIEGEAVLLGFPKLRAGMLVGFGGLSKAPDIAAGSNQQQKLFSLNRIYLVERATHILDVQTGKYRVHVQVSSSDSSKYDKNKIFDAVASLDTPIQDGNLSFFEAFSPGAP